MVAKMELHRGALMRGYIAMLVVEKQYRALGIGGYGGGGAGGRAGAGRCKKWEEGHGATTAHSS